MSLPAFTMDDPWATPTPPRPSKPSTALADPVSDPPPPRHPHTEDRDNDSSSPSSPVAIQSDATPTVLAQGGLLQDSPTSTSDGFVDASEGGEPSHEEPDEDGPVQGDEDGDREEDEFGQMGVDNDDDFGDFGEPESFVSGTEVGESQLSTTPTPSTSLHATLPAVCPL
jgi:hypothetical protein